MSLTKGKIIGVEEASWNQIRIDATSPDSRHYENTILKNYQSISGLFRLEIKLQNQDVINESDTEMGITNSWLLACESFGSSLYAGSIMFASIAVECVLNHDLCLDSYRLAQSKNPDKQWIMLGKESLQEADRLGIPVNLLCGSNDRFPDDVKFVKRRNKIAHGDTEGYANTQRGSFTSKSHTSISHTTVTWQPTKEHALEQIEKAKKFIIQWASAVPQPILRIH
jgi:hypothetical protein